MKGLVTSLTSLLAGVLFALGLGISGMTQPAKVVAFLDVGSGSQWDPSLAFVMVGAIGVYAVAYRLILKRDSPTFGSEFHTPTATQIDVKLMAGASLFGLGWGLGGFCPGPAIASLASLTQEVLIFVGSMAAGMASWRLIARKTAENS